MNAHSRCFIESNGGLTVDRGRGIIHGVKILGLVSENGRRYLPSAVKAATRLYEGIKVNIDHPDNPGDTRSATDRIGKLVNVHYVEGKGLFGDFEVNAGHPFAEQLFYAAEHMPDIYGMSHNAQGDGEDIDGVFVVNKIVEVRSVDLVADPATTKALNESKTASTLENAFKPEADQIRRELDKTKTILQAAADIADDLMRQTENHSSRAGRSYCVQLTNLIDTALRAIEKSPSILNNIASLKESRKIDQAIQKPLNANESTDSPSKRLLQKAVELIRKKQLFDAFQLLNKVAGQTRSSQKNTLLDLSRDAKKLAYQQTKNQLDSKDLTSLLNHVETLFKSWTESHIKNRKAKALTESETDTARKAFAEVYKRIRSGQFFQAADLMTNIASGRYGMTSISSESIKSVAKAMASKLVTISQDLDAIKRDVDSYSKTIKESVVETESKTVSGKNHILTESETNIARKAFADALGLIQSGKVPEAIELLSNMASGRLGISSERIKSVANQKANALIALNQYLKIMKKDLDNYSKTIKESVVKTESKTISEMDGGRLRGTWVDLRDITLDEFEQLVAKLHRPNTVTFSKEGFIAARITHKGKRFLVGKWKKGPKDIYGKRNSSGVATYVKPPFDYREGLIMNDKRDAIEADNPDFKSKAAGIISGDGDTEEKVAALVELVQSMYGSMNEAEEPEMEYKDGEMDEAEDSASDEVDTEEADAVHVDIGSHGGEDDAEMKEQDDDVNEEEDDETEAEGEDEKKPMEAKESRRYITRLCRASRVKLSEQLVNDLKGLPRATIQRQISRIALAQKARKPRSSIVATMTESKIPQGDDLFRWLRS